MTRAAKHRDVWRRAARGRLQRIAAAVFLGLGGASGAASAALPDRVVGEAAAPETVRFTLTLPLRNQAELARLLEQLYTPGSPQFHQFLGPAEFDARFGPTQAQYDDLKSLAAQYGMRVVGEHASRTLLNVEASAATINNVLGARVQVREQADGARYFDIDREPALPFVLSAIGADAAALRQKPAHTHLVTRDLGSLPGAAQPRGGTAPNGTYGPSDLQAAYNLKGIENGGTAVALYELSSANYGDVGTFAAFFGLGNPQLNHKPVDGGTTDTSGAGEVILDIDAVLAISQPSQIYIYTAANGGNGQLDAYSQIADDGLVNQVSTSWGICESQAGSGTLSAENTIFTKMAAEGMTLFAASGDDDAYDCANGSTTLAVDDPGSQTYVTDVGGTSLTTSANQGYVTETVWNNSTTSGSGGGISGVWSIPSYQKGVSFNGPAGQYSASMRNVPDVAADADAQNSGLYTFVTTSKGAGWVSSGGTSAAAPQWAAYWSLIGKGLGKSPGFANPILYQIAQNATAYASDFHDITSGNNGYYSAAKGFDDVTGWGSYNGAKLYGAVIAAAGGSSGSGSSSGSGGSSGSSSSSSGGGSSGSSSGNPFIGSNAAGGGSGGGAFNPAALVLLGLGSLLRRRRVNSAHRIIR